MPRFMGIDIGSYTSKGVVVENGSILDFHILRSGIDYRQVAERIFDELLGKVGLTQDDITAIVTTGQGGDNLSFHSRQVTDTRCCARGINKLFSEARTIIDVQAQFTQVIRVTGSGQIVDFATSEKCAAGSGSFLDIVANVLQIDLAEVGPLSLESGNPVTFTTGCAVFGESEAISRVAEGIPKEDILAGIHKALAGKITSLVDRVGLEDRCVISGGGALNSGLVRQIEDNLGVSLLIPPQPQIVNALGAAILAEREHA